MTVRFTAAAEAHVREIRAWSEQRWGKDRTRAFLSGLLDAIERLDQQPHMGRNRPAFGRGIRSIRYKSYAVFYVVRSEDVLVAGIIHESRSLKAMKAAARLKDI